MNIYTVYEHLWVFTVSQDFRLGNSLLEAFKLNTNVDSNK